MGDTAIPAQAPRSIAVLRTQGYDTLDAGSLAAFEATLDRLRAAGVQVVERSEEHTSELQSLMRISYAVFCLKKKNIKNKQIKHTTKKVTNKHRQMYYYK